MADTQEQQEQKQAEEESDKKVTFNEDKEEKTIEHDEEENKTPKSFDSTKEYETSTNDDLRVDDMEEADIKADSPRQTPSSRQSTLSTDTGKQSDNDRSNPVGKIKDQSNDSQLEQAPPSREGQSDDKQQEQAPPSRVNQSDDNQPEQVPPSRVGQSVDSQPEQAAPCREENSTETSRGRVDVLEAKEEHSDDTNNPPSSPSSESKEVLSSSHKEQLHKDKVNKDEDVKLVWEDDDDVKNDEHDEDALEKSGDFDRSTPVNVDQGTIQNTDTEMEGTQREESESKDAFQRNSDKENQDDLSDDDIELPSPRNTDSHSESSKSHSSSDESDGDSDKDDTKKDSKKNITSNSDKSDSKSHRVSIQVPAQSDTNKSQPNKNKTRTQTTPRQASTRDSAPSSARSKQSSQSPRYMATKERTPITRRETKSAHPLGRRAGQKHSTGSRENTLSSRGSSRAPSRARTTLGFSQEKRQREFFTAELERLKSSLKKESVKIKRPKIKDHFPDVYTSLKPYYDTATAEFLIEMPDCGYEEKQPDAAKEYIEKRNKDEDGPADLMYTTRCTAIGLCDPWVNLNMDKSVLPIIETSEIRKKRSQQATQADRSTTPRKSADQKKRPKEGSTRLPKFPVINLSKKELATQELIYSDVPMIRDELAKSYSHNGKDRVQDDYTRTKQDFYRMELDQMSDYHKNSRGNMRAVYFAYLQNTPGSKKAIYDCMKAKSKKKEVEEVEVVEEQSSPQEQTVA